ncbi:hypothetical protein BGZ58_004429, partial [Dissophora ornata]
DALQRAYLQHHSAIRSNRTRAVSKCPLKCNHHWYAHISGLPHSLCRTAAEPQYLYPHGGIPGPGCSCNSGTEHQLGTLDSFFHKLYQYKSGRDGRYICTRI